MSATLKVLHRPVERSLSASSDVLTATRSRRGLICWFIRHLENVVFAGVDFALDPLDDPVVPRHLVDALQRADHDARTSRVAGVNKQSALARLHVPRVIQPFRPVAVVLTAFPRHLKRLNYDRLLAVLRHHASSIGRAPLRFSRFDSLSPEAHVR